MNALVKLGLGTIGTAGAATSVYYGGDFLLNHFEAKQEEMPFGRPLLKDAEFLDSAQASPKPKTEFSSKYASDYARFLVGTGADSSTEPKSNSGGGDWVFKTKYESSKETFKGGFKNLVRGAKGNSSDNGSIQEVCDKVYKSDKNKIKQLSSVSDDTSEFGEEQIGILCSPLGVKPKTIEEAEKVEGSTAKTNLESDSVGRGKLGANKKTDLLDIDSGENVKAWAELNRQYQSENLSTGFFKKEESNSKGIKDKCGDAYKVNEAGSDASDTTKPTEDDLYKWCSLKGYKSSSTS